METINLNNESQATKPSPKAPKISLQTFALAALAAQLGNFRDDSPELDFLHQQLQIVTGGSTTWIESLRSHSHQPAAQDVPLIRLRRDLGLTLLEILVVALAIAVEEDVLVGRAIARLQAPLGGSRPTLGLLANALAEAANHTHLLNRLLTGNAIQSGLLIVLNESAPLPERAISIPLHLALALNEYDGTVPDMAIGLGDIPEVTLAPSILAEAQCWAGSLQASSQRVLMLRTGSIAEGKSVAQAIAQALNTRPLFIHTEKTTSLVPWLLSRQLLPVFCFDLSPGERKILPSLPGYHKPILVLCGQDGSVEMTGETILSWAIPVPDRTERQQLWQMALGDTELASTLASHHRHSSGRIAQLGRLAHHQRLLQGRSNLTAEDITAAAWIGEGVGLDALAQPLPDRILDEALVMTPTLREELEMLLLRCRSRDRLTEGLGISATSRYRPGVRVLFVGSSGTGKTLAAGWIATQLGMPLYRVDLASITSKYIGETEKNLAQLLTRAEQAEVVLLFDEADSLFGKRTDVKDSNDRFANAQTNYLLQRIESFDGITLLTSNSRGRFDSAFSRRLDLIIEFPLPGPEERRSLWQSHLGEHHNLTQKDLNQLAAVADLGGGHIRNAVFAAAVLAVEQKRSIEFRDIVQGLAGEYRKLGRQIPVELKLKS